MNKTLLTVSSGGRVLAHDKVEALRDSLEPVADSLGCELLILSGGLDVEVHQDLRPVVAAIEDNTAAVRQMAEACMALVNAMAMEDEDDHPPVYHLDGSPVQGLDAG